MSRCADGGGRFYIVGGDSIVEADLLQFSIYSSILSSSSKIGAAREDGITA